MKKVLVVIAILVAAAACGGAGSTVGSTAGAPTLSHGPAQNGSSGTPSKTGGQPGSTDVANPSNPSYSSTVPAIQGPQVIRQAQLSINVSSGSFDSKLAAVRALVQLEQGFISGTDAQASPTSPSDQIRSGVISFMVPAAKFDDTIDLQARLANEEAQRNAMLALLGKAQSVADIIAVQNQLGQITQQIEQLKGQIAYIEHNTTYSSVSVSVSEAGAPAQPAQADSWGFASALTDAAHNFVTTINYIISGLGAIGPIVILLGLGYLLWRRRGSPFPRRA
jgi:hypothetical protein